jgi:hypothetical protein
VTGEACTGLTQRGLGELAAMCPATEELFAPARVLGGQAVHELKETPDAVRWICTLLRKHTRKANLNGGQSAYSTLPLNRVDVQG